MATPNTQSESPVSGLYGFVRNHLATVNGLVLASGTVVALLDFLAPRVSVLPRVIYSITFGLVILMVLAAVAPAMVGRALAAIGLAFTRSDSTPLWRKPAWQAAVALLALVTAVGYASVAKASQGGLLASAVPAVRSVQEDFLAIRGEVSDIGVGVRAANTKLDALATAVDPNTAADRCPDLACAFDGGASSNAVRRLFEKGVKMPGNPINDGVLLRIAAFSPSADRLKYVDLIFQNGIDRNFKILHTSVLGPNELTPEAVRWAREVVEVSSVHKLMPKMFNPGGNEDVLAWNEMAGCFLRSSEGMTLLEFAALRGDGELVSHLVAGGSKPLARPLVCSADSLGKRGYARVVFDQSTGKILAVKGSPT